MIAHVKGFSEEVENLKRRIDGHTNAFSKRNRRMGAPQDYLDHLAVSIGAAISDFRRLRATGLMAPDDVKELENRLDELREAYTKNESYSGAER